jgi:DNA-binding NarL/FixJ family response regulator
VIRVLLADDQSLVRAGLRVLLEGEEDIEVAAEAGDGEEAVALALAESVDVILMDLQMPGMGGLEATRLLVADERLPEVKVVILTTFETDENIFETLRAGASGFLLKDSDPAELLKAIRVVAGGEALLAPSVTRRLIADVLSRPDTSRVAPHELRWLTEREREVMALVAAGLSNREIAAQLVISPATAKTHVSRAMRKLHAHDRAQLVVLAYEAGLVLPRIQAPSQLVTRRPTRPSRVRPARGSAQTPRAPT